MSNAPLMPKATAIWLVDNTALSFEQIADFCKLHALEVKAIADGDAAQGIKGLDPILTGQLTREEIEKAEQDRDYRLQLANPKVRLPQPSTWRRCLRRVGRRACRNKAGKWLVSFRGCRRQSGDAAGHSSRVSYSARASSIRERCAMLHSSSGAAASRSVTPIGVSS